MKFDQDTIIKILLDGNYIVEEDVEKAKVYAEEHRVSPTEYLLLEGLTSTDIIGQAIAEYLKLPYANLNSNPPSKDQVLLIPEDLAKKLHVVVFSQNDSEVVIATDNTENESIETDLSPLFPDKKIKLNFALSDDIDAIFINYKQGLKTEFSKIIESKGRVAPEILDQIFEDALLLKASDIHCEPQEQRVIIRFRIDGILHDAGELPKDYYENIVNRIKVQSKLRIDEHLSAQDGSLRYVSKNYPHPVDLRVSIVPILDGEKVVIRVLSSYVRDLTLSDIGLSKELQDQISKSSKKPFGMILVTGPTGSGKTTTLYSIIKIINTQKSNITTIEDPVEYKIQGVNQIQVNALTNLTFAKGLRAVTRQDPNVIFVGEIRDLETADIAVNAALTGHLLLSTFHANNATAAIPRFIDMGIEPFLAGSTVELVIAQRLVRKICDSCKVSASFSKTKIEKFGPEVSKYFTGKSYNFYKGKGCANCSNTGFRGRVGVFEFLITSPELQDLIGKSPSTKEVFELVRSQGFKTMFEDGVDKVKDGVTTLEELLRVVIPQ
jgi:type II secretory ATPase GspE/PulE/Tfp pilus assembly ATPase PilB-like protein